MRRTARRARALTPRTATTTSVVAVLLLVGGCKGHAVVGTTHSSPDQLTQTRPTTDPSSDASVSPPEPTYSPVAGFVPDAQALADRKRHPNFGYLSVLKSSGPTRLNYDKALWLGGNEANKAAAEHGDETPVPNDYYIVNDNKRLRTVTLAKGVKVWGSLGLNSYAGDGDRIEPAARTVNQLLGFLGTEQGKRTGFDLTFNASGLVLSVTEQYQP